MATVNVYTYYTHKLAYEKGRGKNSTQPSDGSRVSALLLWAALICLVCYCPCPLALKALSTVLAGAILWVANYLHGRSGKFMRALQGLPLGADDLNVLCGR
ncbi:hypothetical protein IV102_25785 [bacterium]|nr:hypothetical protein [bacterium]